MTAHDAVLSASKARGSARPILLRADTRALPLADASVDLIVTSPPYFGLRSYTDGGEHYEGQIGSEATPAAFIDELIACTREWMRVLRPTGSLWVNLGDKFSTYESRPGRAATHEWAQKSQQAERYTHNAPQAYGIPYKSLMGLPWRYALRCIDELGLILRTEQIWAKPNGMPETVRDRTRRSHEQWFHLTSQPTYYADLDPIREPHGAGTAGRYATGYGDRGGVNAARPSTGYDLGGNWKLNPLGKVPGSVWEINTQPLNVPAELGVDHFAAFPMEWPRRLILAWSPPSGVVLDPFGGTGTTALVASVLGRTGISVDRSADYCRVAAWRTTDPGERSRAMCVPRPEPVAPAQLDLLSEAAS